MEYNGQRVTIMGLGHFGGGVAAARWLARQGAIVTVTDSADEKALADALPRLADVPIAALHLGGHREEDFRQADLVVVNPAVRPNSPWLQIARNSGVKLRTELELFIEHCPATIIGVTGTNGKSTTAAMIASILRERREESRGERGEGREKNQKKLSAFSDQRSEEVTSGRELVASGQWSEQVASGRELVASDQWSVASEERSDVRGQGSEFRGQGPGARDQDTEAANHKSEIINQKSLAPSPQPLVSYSNPQSLIPNPLVCCPHSNPLAKADGAERQQFRRTFLGGNIGGSLLEDLPLIGPNDWVVLEISSFQLWYFSPEVRMPHVAVVTGCQPNHLDWHSDFAEYVAAKQRILTGQTPADFAVLNTWDPEVATWANLVRGRQVMLPSPESLFSFAGVISSPRLVAGEEGRETGRSSVLNQQISNPPSPPAPLPQAGEGSNGSPSFSASTTSWCPPQAGEGSNGSPSFSASTTSWCPPQAGEGSFALSVPGEHNRINAACAAAAASAVGCSDDEIRRGLESYRALPQRLEWFATVEGRRFYNDSAATTPESTIAALRSLDMPVWLLIGGKSKGADFESLASEIIMHARGVATFGATAREIDERVAAQPVYIPHVAVDTMQEALQWCWARSQPGDVILLSPACASTDQFRNFRQRGEQFVELVDQLCGQTSS